MPKNWSSTQNPVFFNKLTSAGIKEYSTGDDDFINCDISLDAVKLLVDVIDVIVDLSTNSNKIYYFNFKGAYTLN